MQTFHIHATTKVLLFVHVLPPFFKFTAFAPCINDTSVSENEREVPFVHGCPPSFKFTEFAPCIYDTSVSENERDSARTVQAFCPPERSFTAAE